MNLSELVDISAQEYESRAEAVLKANFLREKMAKETVSYNNDIKEFSRDMEHNRKLWSFMSSKANEKKVLEFTLLRCNVFFELIDLVGCGFP